MPTEIAPQTILAQTILAQTVLAIGSRVSLQSMGEGEGGVLLRLDTGEMYTVNDTTMEFLTLVDGTRPIKAIVASLVETFDVDEQTLLDDMTAIATDLAAENLVVIA
jgi:hypothetical protein